MIIELFNNHEEILVQKEQTKKFRFNQTTTLREFEKKKVRVLEQP